MKTMNLTKKQKAAIVSGMLSALGDYIEFFEERRDAGGGAGLEGVDSETVAAYVSQLASRLPGTTWDTRLPMPMPKVAK